MICRKNVIYQLLGAKNPMSLVSEVVRRRSISSFTVGLKTLFWDPHTTAPHCTEAQSHYWGMQSLQADLFS